MRKSVLLAVAALFICACLATAPSLFAQQYPTGDFSLYGGQMEISDAGWPLNGQEQQLFSTAPIQVKGSKVTMGASFGSTYDFGYGPASGTTSISGEGQYDSRAGTISGTFTYTNSISGAADDLSGTMTTNCQGTFSTPPISANRAPVTASFTGTVNITTTVGGESVTDSQGWSRDVVYNVKVVEQEVAGDSGVRFSDLSGDVDVILPGTGEDNWKMAKLGMVLPYGTLIRTHDDSSAILTFSTTDHLVMEPETIINLGDKPEEPNKLKILMGNILVNVKHMIKYGGMKVEMSQAVAGIKGTVFSLEEVGTTSTLKVFEGTLEFESKATGESVEVVAGRTVSADKNGLGDDGLRHPSGDGGMGGPGRRGGPGNWVGGGVGVGRLPGMAAHRVDRFGGAHPGGDDHPTGQAFKGGKGRRERVFTGGHAALAGRPRAAE